MKRSSFSSLSSVAAALCLVVVGCGAEDTTATSADVSSADAAGSDVGGDAQTGSDATGSDTTGSDTSWPETDNSPCELVLCSGHGICHPVNGVGVCTCQTDYEASGTNCLHSKSVPCQVDAPEHATAVETSVEVTYTTAGGWAKPAACAWNCEPGWSRVGDACMASKFVTEQCRLGCLELQSCGKGGDTTLETCITACAAGAVDANAFAKTACVATLYEHDALWCGVLDACDTLASGDTCTTRCEAKGKCGFFDAPGVTSGTSQGECEVLCRGYDTVFGHLKTNEVYDACLQKAATSCDPFQLALCEAYNGADVCGNICGWLGTDDYCGYIPGRWDTEAACKTECGTWTPKQAHFVFGCYNKLNFSGCDSERALACFTPPADLPSGATTLVASFGKVCPDVLASADPAVNAWHLAGRSALWPTWMHNVGAAADCISAMTSCPSAYNYDWLASCFLPTDSDVEAACNTALQCPSQNTKKVPFLTIDGQTVFDKARCKLDWQLWKQNKPAEFGAAASCLAKLTSTDCGKVDACIAGKDPEVEACESLMGCWDTAGSNPYGLPNMDAKLCGAVLAMGNDPQAVACINGAADCTAKGACLPISELATSAKPACTALVPCWQELSVNPFPNLGTLSVETCAAGTSLFNAQYPGVADLIYNCLQSASDCSAKMACLPK